MSLDVARGSIHVVVGPNGAGKSTLLLATLGQTQFTGRITRVVAARRHGRLRAAEFRRRPDAARDGRRFSGAHAAAAPVCLGIGPAMRARILELLAASACADFSDRPLSVLSGGELRRVLLAHALDPLPELLILDEPAAGLDAAAGRWLEEMLVSIRERDGVTVLMVSHDHDQARRIADRVTLLDRAVVADGTASEALPAP